MKHPVRKQSVRKQTALNPGALKHGAITSASVIVLALVAAEVAAQEAATQSAAFPGSTHGRYVTGDFHNHTTCSDGTLSLQKLVSKSVDTFGLDWFVQAGHGGNSARNCTLAEDPFEPVSPALGLTAPPTIPAGGQPASEGHGPNQTWVATMPGGEAAIKGDVVLQNGVRSMWKWQEVQDYIYPVIEQASIARDKPIFVGLEQVVPGHEHCSTGMIDGQLPASSGGNADEVAQYEYCFDRADTDTSRGADNQWDCAVAGSANNSLLDPAAHKIIPAAGTGTGSGSAGHVKTVEGVKWMNQISPRGSYFVPAHLERAGAFNPNSNAGYNIENLRDFHNAAPEIAFGFESMPGHQADSNRGSYTPGAVGGGTFGGTGVYAGAIGGVWDALLGEGRHWWFFASSDYHNRGSFGPDQLESSADFFPGEYTKDYVSVQTARRFNPRDEKYGPQEIVDGLRSGNSYVVNGDLIDRMTFEACIARGRSDILEDAAILAAAVQGESFSSANCATMGETLSVRRGDAVVIHVLLRDPPGKNNSPYSFPNPSLRQIGITQPLNAPVLDHVDLIGGDVTGIVPPTDTARYAGLIGSPAATNPSAAIKATFNKLSWKTLLGWHVMSYRVKSVDKDQYVRLRGTNLPPATPSETDNLGNPLLDFGAQLKIPCTDAACPAHMALDASGAKTSSNDVAAWSDLWFYSNPIFVKVQQPRPRR